MFQRVTCLRRLGNRPALASQGRAAPFVSVAPSEWVTCLRRWAVTKGFQKFLTFSRLQFEDSKALGILECFSSCRNIKNIKSKKAKHFCTWQESNLGQRFYFCFSSFMCKEAAVGVRKKNSMLQKIVVGGEESLSSISKIWYFFNKSSQKDMTVI